MVSQIKMTRHAAPKAPPTCVREKKTKKLPPKVMQTHGWAAGRTRRKVIAAGIRNKIKYAKVLKIIRGRRGKFWWIINCRNNGANASESGKPDLRARDYVKS